LRGAVTLDNLVAIRREGEAALAAADTPTSMDISGLENGNSAALALLMAWFREAQAQGKEVVFTDIPSELVKIIELSGMAEVLPLAERSATSAQLEIGG